YSDKATLMIEHSAAYSSIARRRASMSFEFSTALKPPSIIPSVRKIIASPTQVRMAISPSLDLIAPNEEIDLPNWCRWFAYRNDSEIASFIPPRHLALSLKRPLSRVLKAALWAL